MADIEVQAILRCGLCSKPFFKQSTLKRHGYYCRSRNTNSRSVRSRSCVACAKAKARCDNKFPGCTRCVAKNIECCSRIDSAANIALSGKSGKEPQRTRLHVKEGPSRHTPTRASPSSVNSNAISTGSEYATLDLDFTNFGGDMFDWGMLDINVSGVQDLDDQPIRPSLLESTGPLPMTQSASSPTHGVQTGQIAPISSPSIPTMPTFHLRSFVQNPAIKGGAQTTAMLMVRILTSYPMMMRGPGSLPPFIHPYFLSDIPNSETPSLESLTTCVSLMQMVNTDVQGSKKLFWKNVRLECERLHEECAGLDKWGLLSSMQALLIYILLRLQEGETLYNNFDVLLLSTLSIVAYALKQRIGTTQCDASPGLSYGLSWQDWIFEESRRRLAITFRAINMLFSMEPARRCVLHDGFLLAPLPARKQLWEARDESLWMLEKSRHVCGLSEFGIMVNGQMVKLNENQPLLGDEPISVQPGIEQESSANWQEWCSGMDGLGALVTLATSLPISYL